ncbi:MAG: hypothetical protein MRJ52_02245 [Nitrosomonas sp.]|nr:hypothetical protein [Nitrosomonas sp.]
MAFKIKLKDPVEVNTDFAGPILLGHWNLSAMGKAEKMAKLKDGSAREFMEEFVTEFARKADDSIEDKHDAYERGAKLKNLESASDQDLEKIAQAYITSESNSMIPYVSEREEDYEVIKERNEKLRVLMDGETHQEYLRRLVNASLEGFLVHSKKIAEQFSSLTKKWQEPLLRNSMALKSLGMQIDDIRSIQAPQIPVIENPIHETNARLNNVSGQLEKLTLLTDAEIKQAELLNDKTASLLEAAAESSNQAKKSIYIA